MTTRIGSALTMGLREYGRTPLLLALLVFLPAYMVGVFSSVVPDSQIAFEVGSNVVRTEFPELYAVTMVPMVGALMGGITGLFTMQAAKAADARLVLAGFRAWEVVLVRFGLLALSSLVVTAVSLGVMGVFHTPVRLGWVAVATVMVTTIYGAIGLLVGVLAGRLVGVFVLLFAAMFDVFFYQNPTVSDPAWIAPYLPSHYPTKLAIDAAFTPVVDLQAVGAGLVYLVALVGAAGLAFRASLSLE